jgi:N-acetylglutamate synthase
MHPDTRRLEELSMNAWPALGQMVHDGWLLRFAGGYTGRSNSVQPLYDGALDPHEKIGFCEQAYARMGIPCLFKMTAAARPADLDALLEARGYRAFNHASVQVLEFSDHDGPVDSALTRASDRPEDAWLQSVAAFRSIDARHVPTLRAILRAIALPARYVTVTEGHDIVACGLAVLERPWVGLFDIVTREDLRRRGRGTRLVHALLDWARREGATGAYLPVAKENAPALRLYERLGFREAYTYWYRGKRS